MNRITYLEEQLHNVGINMNLKEDPNCHQTLDSDEFPFRNPGPMVLDKSEAKKPEKSKKPFLGRLFKMVGYPI